MSGGILNYVESLQGETASLDVHECLCGFHIGVDTTYLEQVSSVSIACPACDNSIYVAGYENVEEPEALKVQEHLAEQRGEL